MHICKDNAVFEMVLSWQHHTQACPFPTFEKEKFHMVKCVMCRYYLSVSAGIGMLLESWMRPVSRQQYKVGTRLQPIKHA